MLEDFAAMSGIEFVVIDADTKLRQFKQELEWNAVAYARRRSFLA
jgi:L-arabinose isomerase